MKNLSILITLLVLASCTKVTPSKIKGKWVATMIISNDSTEAPLNPSTYLYYQSYFNGQNTYSVTNDGGNISYDTSFNSTMEIEFFTDNSFEITFTGTININGELHSSFETMKGAWSLPGKDKTSDFKKGDRILLTTYERSRELVNQNTSEMITYNTTYTNIGFSEESMLFNVEELSKNKLVLSWDFKMTDYSQMQGEIFKHNAYTKWEFQKENTK